MPRFYLPLPLRPDQQLALPASAARHVQVLRLQPGDALNLFDGQGAEWAAEVLRMGRSEVEVRVREPVPTCAELPCAVTLAIGMPANERMDTLVEKATELGVARLQPLLCERAVLRVQGERADKKVAHWQSVAVAACEQSGRAKVPVVAPVRSLAAWLQGLADECDSTVGEPPWCGLLSLRGARPLATCLPGPGMPRRAIFLSGPEGGLSPAEEEAAKAAGFQALGLGPRTLRADTAPLVALAWIGLRGG